MIFKNFLRITYIITGSVNLKPILHCPSFDMVTHLVHNYVTEKIKGGYSKKCIFFVITIKSLYQVTLLTKVSVSEVHELVSKEA